VPPRENSRYQFCTGVLDADGNLYLTQPEPFRFSELADNRFHPVVVGDTLQGLAARYFPSFEKPDRLWWVIGHFQPDPIHDPTLRLPTATTMVVPSERTLREQIFNRARREEHTA
jgi:hypothetical protein